MRFDLSFVEQKIINTVKSRRDLKIESSNDI